MTAILKVPLNLLTNPFLLGLVIVFGCWTLVWFWNVVVMGRQQ